MTAVRLDDDLIAEVDRERNAAGLSRAKVIQEALSLWLERRKVEAAVRRDQKGYRLKPVSNEEFARVVGAQVWPQEEQPSLHAKKKSPSRAKR